MVVPLLRMPDVFQLSIKMTDTQESVQDDSNKKEKEILENSNKEKTLNKEETSTAFNWKKELPCVIRSGNIDRLEEIMEAEDFDIDTTWFQENLLMIAIRAGQTEMAEFLIDNGINYNFTRKVLDYKKSAKQVDCYVVSCRQMAYDYRMTDIVNLIDQKSNQLFSFIKLRQRTPRIHLSKKLASDDSEEVPNSCLDISVKEGRRYQQKRSLESKYRNLSASYQKGLNLHRFTPDLILRERKKGQQLYLPLYRNSPRSDVVRNSLSATTKKDGVSLSRLTPLPGSSLAVTDVSFHWSVQKKNDKNSQSPKTRLTTTRCWTSNNSSRRVNSIERQFRKISCGDVTSNRIRSQTPPQKNVNTFSYGTTPKWIDKPKYWVP